MRRMRRFLIAVAITGCASAGKPSFGERPDSGIHLVGDGSGGGSDGSGGGSDGSVQIDAPQSGGQHTLNETTDQTDTGIGIACGNATTGYTSKNSYYRVFALSDYGITGSFAVSSVNFVDAGSSGSPSLKVSVGVYSGTPGATLATANISLMSSMMVTPTDTTTATPMMVPVLVTIPAGSNLIAEVDQTVAGSATSLIQFYPGANPDGETKPGYIMSTDCMVNAPESMTTAAMAETDLVLTVTGTAQ